MMPAGAGGGLPGGNPPGAGGAPNPPGAGAAGPGAPNPPGAAGAAGPAAPPPRQQDPYQRIPQDIRNEAKQLVDNTMKADEYLEQAELAKKLTEALQLCVDEYNNRMNPPGRTAQERQQQVANFRTWLINQKIGEPGQLLGDFHAMFTGPDGEETYQLFPVKASALNKLNDGRLGADLASALDAMKGWRPILLPGSRLNLDRLNHAQVYDAIKRHRDQHRGTIDNFDAQHQDRRRRDATMRCLRDIYSDENGARLNSKQARLEETSLRSVIPAGQVQLIRNAYHRV